MNIHGDVHNPLSNLAPIVVIEELADPDPEINNDEGGLKNRVSSTTDNPKLQDLTNDTGIRILVGTNKNNLRLETLTEKTQLDKAIRKEKLVKIEHGLGEGFDTLKLTRKQIKNLNLEGKDSIEILGANGIKHRYQIKDLSDEELEVLITNARAYIVFLKANADPTDKETEKVIHHHESQLKQLELEKAVRNNDKAAAKEILRELSSHGKAIAKQLLEHRMAELFAVQEAIHEEREKLAEEHHNKTICIVISREVLDHAMHESILKADTLRSELTKHQALHHEHIPQFSSRIIQFDGEVSFWSRNEQPKK